MKSKKILAMIVAFAAFMAFATSGFAAVTTETVYNGAAGKLEIKVTADAVTDKEVTYLVKSNDSIVYIDQQTAKDGKVVFEYKIAQNDIAEDLSTSVQFGTDADEAIDSIGSDIEIANISATGDAGVASIEYFKDALCADSAAGIIGNDETVYVRFNLVEDYEIASVKIRGVEQQVNGNVYAVVYGEDIAVTTEAPEVTPEVVAPDGVDPIISEEEVASDAAGNDVAVKSKVAIMSVAGDPTEVGIYFNGEYYKAYASEGVAFTSGLCAVKIQIPAEMTDLLAKPMYRYYKVGENITWVDANPEA